MQAMVAGRICGLAFLLASLSSAHAASLQEAAELLHADQTQSVEITGAAHWFATDASHSSTAGTYTADIDYETASSHVHTVVKQAANMPQPISAPVKDAFVSRGHAWDFRSAENAGADTPAAFVPRPLELERRASEIWMTPQGFLKAALSHAATSAPEGDGIEISFAIGDTYHFTGTIDAQNRVERINFWKTGSETSPLTLEMQFADYAEEGGVPFPTHMSRLRDGEKIFDLRVESVHLNPSVAIDLPSNISELEQQPSAGAFAARHER